MGGGFFLLRLQAPEIARDSKPGEFVLLRGQSQGWPYLMRPFSIHSSDGESSIGILYKVVGRATSIMSETPDGSEFDTIGPLGEGFTLRDRFSLTLVLAGGIGIAPLGFYCQTYVEVLERIILIVGAKRRRELLVPVGLSVQGIELRPYTEDGTRGSKGTVIDGFRQLLGEPEAAPESIQVVACGPREMLFAVAGICADRGIACQVSVEEMMACGIGACLSCAVPRSGGGYLHACEAGPVLDATVIDWKRWVGQ